MGQFENTLAAQTHQHRVDAATHTIRVLGPIADAVGRDVAVLYWRGESAPLDHAVIRLRAPAGNGGPLVGHCCQRQADRSVW